MGSSRQTVERGEGLMNNKLTSELPLFTPQLVSLTDSLAALNACALFLAYILF